MSISQKWVTVTSAATAITSGGNVPSVCYIQKKDAVSTSCFLGNAAVSLTTNGFKLTTSEGCRPLRLDLWPRETLYGITKGTTSVTVQVLRIHASTI